MTPRKAITGIGWTLSLCTAAAAAIVVSSASILWMHAGMRGLRQFGRWWWWDYLWVRTPGNSDFMVNSFLIGAATFATVMLLAWLLARSLKPGQRARPLYGETRPATRGEMQDADIALRRNL